MLAKWILKLAYLSDISVKISKLNGLWSGCDWANREVDGFHRRAEIVEEENGRRQECFFLNTKFASGKWKHCISWCKKCYHITLGKTRSWIWMLLAKGCDGIHLGDSDVKDLTDAISCTTGPQQQCTEIQTTTHTVLQFLKIKMITEFIMDQRKKLNTSSGKWGSENFTTPFYKLHA